MRINTALLFLVMTVLIISCSNTPPEEVTATYPSGKKKETAIFQGKEGSRSRIKSFEYYESGELKKEFSYRDNLLSGQWTYWYRDGKKLGDGVISNKAINLSMVTGKETYYWPNGIKMLEAETEGGALKQGTTAIYRDETGKAYRDKDRPKELVEKSKNILEQWERGAL
jgi:antitoxin component YwqK of YwqJK toxin-antitoxin module